MADSNREDGAVEPDPEDYLFEIKWDTESDNHAAVPEPNVNSAAITQQFREEGLKWKPSQKADPDRISFLDLALEIRNMVYREALAKEPELPNYALFAVCRQTQAEGQAIYYSTNTFMAKKYMVLVEGDMTSSEITLDEALEVCTRFDGPVSAAVNGAIKIIGNAFPKVKHVQLKLKCIFLDRAARWDRLDLNTLLMDQAVKILAQEIGENALPNWFHFELASHEESFWIPVWKELKKRCKEANVSVHQLHLSHVNGREDL
ncbi:uncharacterized protein BDZ99DRAFT_575727 [Mytilinidion resinicola]|uniref:Uncharacterized protein n=1 Tax=Mytilinidion resinicola TaxID=574789 RepID=A0A6A6Y5J1_9PEZI|nr:uncharacterized protein BDZ99DRAFT_575727 [Mytilinidion resinicola]KAF2804076.1 hypothetical protein BDZ99DRAFT_575727 [Mytilinidion resinicola]